MVYVQTLLLASLVRRTKGPLPLPPAIRCRRMTGAQSIGSALSSAGRAVLSGLEDAALFSVEQAEPVKKQSWQRWSDDATVDLVYVTLEGLPAAKALVEAATIPL